MIAAFAGLFWLAMAGMPAAAEPPSRVLSFNLCADQLVLALADPAQIAGLSRFAADPAVSALAEAARQFPQVDARSEAAVALRPDLVLTGPFDRSSVRAVLTRLGLTVAEVGLVADLGAGVAQIREVANLLGHEGRGEALAARIKTAAAQLAASAAQHPRRTALIVERRGHVSGPGTLAAALLRLAGFDMPAGAPAGHGGFVPLERLLMLGPDLLVTYGETVRPDDQGALFLVHPALTGRYPPARRLTLPTRFALCGGPALLAAIEDLTTALAKAHAE